MSWSRKEQPTPFDQQPIEGLWMLDGDLLAQKYKQERLAGQAYPLIHFPSERQHGLSQSPFALIGRPDGKAEMVDALHICGGFLLPLQLSTEEAYQYIQSQAEQYGLLVRRETAYQLRIKAGETRTAPEYVLFFNDETQRLADIQRFPEYAMDLMPEELRAALPSLYETENQGNQAMVSVKYFTPDANWTWYPTEFDGSDIFFGLVAGFEPELGYFSLRELQEIRGALRLPVERDLYFEPQTLTQVREQLSR